MAQNLICLFVRHGQTNYNFQKRFQGHLPVALNETGSAQARRAGELIANLLKSYKLSTGPHPSPLPLFTSDLLRTTQTSQIILEQLSDYPITLVTDPNLREFDTGLCTDKTFLELETLFPIETKNYLNSFDKDPLNTPYPGLGGESQMDVIKRFTSFFKENMRLYNSPWIVCSHGGALQAFLQFSLDLTSKNKLPKRIGNGDILEVYCGDNQWTLKRYYQNDC